MINIDVSSIDLCQINLFIRFSVYTTSPITLTTFTLIVCAFSEVNDTLKMSLDGFGIHLQSSNRCNLVDEPITKFGPDSQGDFQVEPVPSVEGTDKPPHIQLPVVNHSLKNSPAAHKGESNRMNCQAVAPTH